METAVKTRRKNQDFVLGGGGAPQKTREKFSLCKLNLKSKC